MDKLLAGLDIGSTGCKLSVFAPSGQLLGSAYRNYPVLRQQNAHEIDAAAVWSAVQEVLAESAARYPGIAGIGVASFGETFVLLDAADRPILPAMLYTDPRGSAQCSQLTDTLGREQIIRSTGLNPHSMYSLPKLMWLREEHPDALAKTKRILQMQDYIVYLLTGTAQIDYSLATRSMAFDIHRLQWSRELCAAAGVDPALFPLPVPTGTNAGLIRATLATQLGLQDSVRIISVGHDQVAAAIGSGVFDASATVDGAGTVQCSTPVFSDFDPMRMAENNYCIVPYLRPGSYVTYAFSYTGGALVQWFVDMLSGPAAAASTSGTNIHAALEGNWDGNPTGILVLPHFAGAATPYMDSGSKGAIVGLLLHHTQQDLYRAAMEGVCFEMRLNQERLAASGVAMAPLQATGGGAKSRVWMQMKADILNLPVTALESTEAGATGSAMLAGMAVGIFRDLQQAASVLVRPRETFLPRSEVHARYESIYQRYKQLYAAIRPLV